MAHTVRPTEYDLEDRCLTFAIQARNLVRELPKSISNLEYSKQLIRSSSSIGANYIEANEKLSKKDFIHRAKIAKKEAKETRYWLNLVETHPSQADQRVKLIQESRELMNIFGAILQRVKE